MNCQQAKPLIALYADGELEAATILELEKHIHDCATCAVTWRNLQSLKKAVEMTDDILEIEDTWAAVELVNPQFADADAVRRAIAELPVEFREIVILREMEGFSYKEIAELAEVPLGTVMSRLARARKLLQKSLTAAFKPGDQR